MAESKSKTTPQELSLPDSVPTSTVRRLVVTIPILVAVLFTIGYVQIRVQPMTEKSDVQTARQSPKSTPVMATPALQIAPQNQEKLAPLAVTITDVISPTAGSIGDVNASAAAQPSVTSLQAPVSNVRTDDNVLQAHKHSDDSNELFNL